MGQISQVIEKIADVASGKETKFIVKENSVTDNFENNAFLLNTTPSKRREKVTMDPYFRRLRYKIGFCQMQLEIQIRQSEYWTK